VAGAYECSNELSASIKCGEFLDLLYNFKLLKKACAQQSWLFPGCRYAPDGGAGKGRGIRPNLIVYISEFEKYLVRIRVRRLGTIHVFFVVSFSFL
jgi:hypothetical protein